MAPKRARVPANFPKLQHRKQGSQSLRVQSANKVTVTVYLRGVTSDELPQYEVEVARTTTVNKLACIIKKRSGLTSSTELSIWREEWGSREAELLPSSNLLMQNTDESRIKVFVYWHHVVAHVRTQLTAYATGKLPIPKVAAPPVHPLPQTEEEYGGANWACHLPMAQRIEYTVEQEELGENPSITVLIEFTIAKPGGGLEHTVGEAVQKGNRKFKTVIDAVAKSIGLTGWFDQDVEGQYELYDGPIGSPARPLSREGDNGQTLLEKHCAIFEDRTTLYCYPRGLFQTLQSTFLNPEEPISTPAAKSVAVHALADPDALLFGGGVARPEGGGVPEEEHETEEEAEAEEGHEDSSWESEQKPKVTVKAKKSRKGKLPTRKPAPRKSAAKKVLSKPVISNSDSSGSEAERNQEPKEFEKTAEAEDAGDDEEPRNKEGRESEDAGSASARGEGGENDGSESAQQHHDRGPDHGRQATTSPSVVPSQRDSSEAFSPQPALVQQEARAGETSEREEDSDDDAGMQVDNPGDAEEAPGVSTAADDVDVGKRIAKDAESLEETRGLDVIEPEESSRTTDQGSPTSRESAQEAEDAVTDDRSRSRSFHPAGTAEYDDPPAPPDTTGMRDDDSDDEGQVEVKVEEMEVDIAQEGGVKGVRDGTATERVEQDLGGDEGDGTERDERDGQGAGEEEEEDDEEEPVEGRLTTPVSPSPQKSTPSAKRPHSSSVVPSSSASIEPLGKRARRMGSPS